MSQRVLFPTDAEREVVERFLLGQAICNPNYDGNLEVINSRLMLNGVRVAWFDTAGALCAIIPVAYTMHYARLVLNATAEMLGVPGRADFEREGDIVRTFFDGNNVGVNTPFVVCGGLGMSAWRASKGVTK